MGEHYRSVNHAAVDYLHKKNCKGDCLPKLIISLCECIALSPSFVGLGTQL